MQKIWIIGASRGIGRAISILLAKEKNFLILSARNKENLEELSKEIGLNNNLIAALDVNDNSSIIETWNKISNQLGTIDILIYCAGCYCAMSAENIDLNESEKIINTNLLGALRVLSLVIPGFIAKQNGHIILLGGITGYRGLPNSIAYGSSKSGIIHLAENLQCDLNVYNIKIQLVNPGFIQTKVKTFNKLNMSFVMDSTKAAEIIFKKMKTNAFEIKFPFLFANLLKFLSKLPYWLYFLVVKIRKI